MKTGGAMPAGSGRTMRLDPFALPIRFPAKDAGADGQMRQIELDRDRVVLRRAVRGMRMKIRLPVEAFTGITLVTPAAGADTASIILDHCDPLLSIPLLDGADAEEAAVVWKAWGRVLGLALRQLGQDGQVSEVQPGRRSVLMEEVVGRRRRRSSIRKRRPSIFLRRKPGRHIALSAVHRDEREIIART